MHFQKILVAEVRGDVYSGLKSNTIFCNKIIDMWIFYWNILQFYCKDVKSYIQSRYFSIIYSHYIVKIHNCDALHDFLPFVRFRKCEKHPLRSVMFSKVILLRECFSRFFKLHKMHLIVQSMSIVWIAWIPVVRVL